MSLTHRAAFAGLLFSVACATRLPLPPPVSPLVLTEDAPFRSQPPPLPPAGATASEAPVYETATLSNDLSLWVLRRPHAPYVALTVATRGAGKLTSPCAPSILQLTARAIVEGGTRWSDGRIVEPPAINGYGVSWNVQHTGASFSISVLKRSLDTGLRVLARTLVYPAFGAGDLTPVRLNQLKANQNESTVQRLLLDAALTNAFGPDFAQHYLPHDMVQVREAPNATIERCYREAFVPERSAVVVVGDITLEEVRPVAERHFATWTKLGKAYAQPVLTPYTRSSGNLVHWVNRDRRNPQARVLIVQPAPTERDELDHIPFAMLAHIAVGSWRSRSNTHLRHDAGLTYGVRPLVHSAPAHGLLAIEADFEKAQANHAVEDILLMLTELTKMPVSDAELDEAKQAFDTSIDELAASNESLLNLGKQLFVTERKPDWARGLREQGRAITAADLLRVARKYLRPKAADIGVYGSVFVAEDLRWVGNLVQYRYELR